MSIHSIQQHLGVICRRLRMKLHDKRAPCCEGIVRLNRLELKSKVP